jgi:transcriptional regulator GlxA family with amidase domain
VLSGAYQLWHPPLHPLFSQLPPWCVLRADEVAPFSPLALCIGLVRAELDAPQLGSDGVLHGLLDVLFTLLLRETLRRHASATGMSYVLQDAAIHEAVSLLHREAAAAWTLESLAARVGLSRTQFAERFRDAVGETPLQYLRLLRMQQAMRLLAETTLGLEQVAQSVGYQDAFSFSKVFKRTLGLSPRDFRRRDEQEASLPFRFRAG